MLVIEGDANTRDSLVGALREKGFTVEASPEAVPGFRKACELTPDCIVVNPDLPDIDGVWVARKIRTEPGAIAKVPLLFLGELPDKSVRTQALNVGADAFLARPITDEEIVAQVAALIAMARRLDTAAADDEPKSMVSAAIRGDLSAFPIASLLMMFEMERRSGLIEVVAVSGKRARLTLTSGLFASTEIEGAQRPAIEVLREVLAWRAGRFSFQPRESESLPAPRASVGALVLEAMRLEDEEKGPLPELSSDDLVEADSIRGDKASNTVPSPPPEYEDKVIVRPDPAPPPRPKAAS